MALSAGTKPRNYEVTVPIGAGGMGKVYRAKDAKLGREVAIRILPESFTREAERRATFEREVRVRPSLNRHPSRRSRRDGGHLFLVMELAQWLVGGEQTL